MRTETITKTIYTYAELSESAKEKAREWYTQDWDFFSAEYVIDDAVRMGALMGIEIDMGPVKLMGGGVRLKPDVFWSGFSSQGDGACFEGDYRYAKGGVKAVSDECGGNDATLIRIAKGLQAVQKRNFYKLRAVCTHRGHYQHSGCMSVDVEDTRDDYRDIARDDEREVTDLLREFADWIYRQLEEEYEYQTSEEAVAESMEANEYEFDELGNIH